MEGVLYAAVRVGVRRHWTAVGADGEAVAPAEHSQEIVERVVLHHQDHDVLNVRHGVGAWGKVRIGERIRLAKRSASERTEGLAL